MKRQTFIVLVAAVIATTLVSAQTVDLRIFRGFVQIRNIAGSALLVLGGGVFGHTSDPSGAVVDIRSSADGVAAGGALRLSRPAANSYFIINADDDGASGVGYMQAGDDVGYRPLKLQPLGSQVLFGDGVLNAPSVSFVNDTTSGLEKAASTGFFMQAGGRRIASVESDRMSIVSNALGLGAKGPFLFVGRNSSGTGAPGSIAWADKSNIGWVTWFDTSGNFRVSSASPVEGASDTVGTVVGTQTSTRASKDILRRVTETALAMQTIRDTPVYEFRYKNGAYNGETFTGIVTDDSPLFGMDQGKSFNPVSAFGASVLALQDLDARVRELEARLRSLEARR